MEEACPEASPEESPTRPSLVRQRTSYRRRSDILFAIQQRGLAKGSLSYISNPDHRPWRQVSRIDYSDIPGAVVCSWTCKAVSVIFGIMLLIMSVSKMTAEPKIQRETKMSYTEKLKLPEMAIDIRDHKGDWKVEFLSCSIPAGKNTKKGCTVATERLSPCTVDYFKEDNGEVLSSPCLCFNGPSANWSAWGEEYLTVEGTFGSAKYTYHKLSFVYTGPGDGSIANGTHGRGGKVSLYMKDLTSSDTQPMWTSQYYKWSTGFQELNYEMYFRPVEVKETSWHGFWQFTDEAIGGGLLDGRISTCKTELSYLRMDPWTAEPYDWLPTGTLRTDDKSSGRIGINFLFRSGLSKEERTIDHFSLLDVLSDTGGFFSLVTTITVIGLLCFIGLGSWLQSCGTIGVKEVEREHKLQTHEVALLAHLFEGLISTKALNPQQTDEELHQLLDFMELTENLTVIKGAHCAEV